VVKVRDRGHVYPKALVIAYGVHHSGRREVIGLDIGETETETFWIGFLRSLRERGLAGVRLAISDDHTGLKTAIARIVGAPWQRCTVHFVRDMLRHCRPAQRGMVSAALREVFNAESLAAAKERADQVSERLAGPTPKVASLLAAAEEDLLAFLRFPEAHWSKLRSTNPLERVNREIARRADVVGIFPNDAAAIRLAGAMLIEQNDEWLVGRRYLSEESLALVLEDHADAEPEEVKQLPAA
jgi:putative transposase